MELFTLLFLALGYIACLAPISVHADCRCDTEWEYCTGSGTQGSCCAGYKCAGNNKCKVETSLTTSQCTEVWAQSFSDCDCCPGNYCSDEGWGIQCKPNGKNADCRKNEEFTGSTTSSSTSDTTPSSTSGGAVDYTCDKEWEACTEPGGQGSCCPGYECIGDATFTQCHLDPNRDTSGGCKQMYAQCSDLGQCCEGSYCDMSGSWKQCRPGQEGATPAPSSSSMINNDAEAFSLASITGICPYSANLGDGFSGPTGQGHFVGPWPDVQGVPALGKADGRDDSIAFFVGGNYFGNVGAEIEGKIVVLGNFKNNGINALVQVGLGSQIIPNNDQDIILVGGNWEINRDVAVMQNSAYVQGNIKYKGASIGTGQNLWTNGQVERVPNLDLSVYEKALVELKAKSAHWAKQPMNGIFTPYHEGANGNTAVFKGGNNNDCVQVFNLDEDEFHSSDYVHVEFHENLEGKTILINYGSNSNKNVQIKNLVNFYDPSGKSGWEFDSAMTASILWNFYDAEQVDLGAGSTGVGEFTGSILIPDGNLKFEMQGHSGRTIVGGNLEQKYSGSEFHNYPFEPNLDATCQLPLPPCGPEPTSAPTNKPTNKPTNTPTPEPTNLPTPKPTNNPTPEPTPAPSEPITFTTVETTGKPTASPTNNPTPNTSTETPVCEGGGFSASHPGYTALSDPSTKFFGVTQPNSNPIVVGDQNCVSLGFGMTNQYGTTVDYMFVQYKDPRNGSTVCEAFKDVPTCWFAEFSANCMKSTKLSVVTITVVDSSFSVNDTASLPSCCADNAILGEIAGAPDTKVAKYTYVVDCCPETTKCV
jgi:choice-of-anchor A domain-containing protein